MRIEELFDEDIFDLVVIFLRENDILSAEELEKFDFDRLMFVPGVSTSTMEKAIVKYNDYVRDKKQTYERDYFEKIGEVETSAGGETYYEPYFKQEKTIKDELIKEVYLGVPRAAPFVRYCKNKNISMMSQLSLSDFEGAYSLKGLGDGSVNGLKNVYKRYYGIDSHIYTDQSINSIDARIFDIFNAVPRGNSFVHYCEEKGIEKVSELSKKDFYHEAVRGIGAETMDALYNTYLNFMKNIESSQEIYNRNISEQNYKLNIRALSLLGVTRRNINVLLNAGIVKAEDLLSTSIPIAINNIVEIAISIFEKPLDVLFSSAISNCENDGKLFFLQGRVNGDTLQEIADLKGITRERVRQIVSKTTLGLLPFVEAIGMLLLSRNGRNFFAFQEVEDYFNNAVFVEYYKYVLNESTIFVSIDFANKYILIDAFSKNILSELEEVATNIIGEGINYYDSLELVENELNNRGINYIDFADFMNYLLKSGYKFYGDYVMRGKQSYALVCKDAISKYFKNGIKLHSGDDINKLRQIIANKYQNLVLPPKNRALTARCAEYLILSGRGRFTAIENVYYNISIFDEIYSFIQNSTQQSLFYNEVFTHFRGRLLAETNIDNGHFLHGILKYLYPIDFAYERDLLVKHGAIREGVDERLSKIVIRNKSAITKKKIKIEIPGISDIMISMAIGREPKLIQWDFNSYNHIDNLSITDECVKRIEYILEKETTRFKGYISEELLYDAILREFPEFIYNNNISTSLNCFYAVAYFCSDSYSFKRPHIIANYFETESNNMESIAKTLLNYQTGVNYNDFIKLSNDLKWSSVTYACVFPEIEKNCIRVSDSQYVDKNSFHIDQMVLNNFSNQLKDLITDTGYYAIQSIFSYEKFPTFEYEWNDFLIGSLIVNFNCRVKLISPQLKDRRYQRGIMISKESQINSYEELVAHMMKKDNITEMSLNAFEKYLKNKDLMFKVIPQELFNSELIEYKNDKFSVKW